jgi:hypothetical protein
MARRLPPAWLCDAAATSCRRRAAEIGDVVAADDGLLPPREVKAVEVGFDAPAGVVSGGNSGAELDYGPRGPQHRDNMQIRPAI